MPRSLHFIFIWQISLTSVDVQVFYEEFCFAIFSWIVHPFQLTAYLKRREKTTTSVFLSSSKQSGFHQKEIRDCNKSRSFLPTAIMIANQTKPPLDLDRFDD